MTIERERLIRGLYATVIQCPIAVREALDVVLVSLQIAGLFVHLICHDD